MAQIDFKAKLIETDMEAAIKSELRTKIKEVWIDRSDTIRVQAAQIFFKYIIQHPTHDALQSGILKGELGLTDDKFANFMENLEYGLEACFQVKYVGHTGSNDLGGVLAYVDSFEHRFDLDGADYNSANQDGESTFIPWLKWLIKYGTQDIVLGYFYYERSGSGRSGKGVMVPAQGRTYSVNDAYAGTLNHNWFTESAQSARSEIQEMIIQNLRG